MTSIFNNRRTITDIEAHGHSRQGKPAKGISSIVNYQFLAGILVGAILILLFTSGSSTSMSISFEPEAGNGWNPVHVFYGERSALPGANQEWYSQVHQDEIVVDLVGSSGYFIDLAANDAVEFSNTLALEGRGWNGLCIEPNPSYWYALSHRKCTVVGALVGGRKEQVDVQFRGVFGGITGRMDVKLANRKRGPKAETEKRFTAPMREVLERYHVPRNIDYMSLDVEGAEMLIMKEFPFEEYTIRVMTVERPGKDLHALLEQHGYVFLKDLSWWGETLWAHSSTGLTPDHPKIKKIKKVEQEA